ncbi:MAG: hypothetical protein ACLFVP_05865 [Candidatus Bathyarchaeia archaeon]
MKTKFNLPPYPRTEVRGRTVIIQFEDGEELWEDEKDEMSARKEAHEIEAGLKAITYVREHFVKYLNELFYDLMKIGVAKEHLADIICSAFPELDKCLRNIDEII